MDTLNRKMMRIKEVEKLTGISRTSIYRLGAKGEFPKHIKLSVNSSGWLASEVEAWLDSKIQARDAEV
ncbi:MULTISPECIES: helix-turn-helix transcriptional regulator [unclassified Francisella]|uniref:helix-turn-helix transcriptional regulator n=1 Tax=unclassified Francisella TaxID=2610885 RepID=UPI002E37E46B|nr:MULTISPECIES: AlpA family transcriptional regulator [unclassified Francisella]MED7820145.1 AlpA family transcriptional regulator [Francisella sp. 19S2-4]MED7830965.1 AlpA family transcriptional regulator [Francisella sp. 19S2-10]